MLGGDCVGLGYRKAVRGEAKGKGREREAEVGVWWKGVVSPSVAPLGSSLEPPKPQFSVTHAGTRLRRLVASDHFEACQ